RNAAHTHHHPGKFFQGIFVELPEHLVGKVATGRELHQSCSSIVTGLEHLLPQFDVPVEEQRDQSRVSHRLCHFCSCILCHWFFSFNYYLATLPEASPPISFS